MSGEMSYGINQPRRCYPDPEIVNESQIEEFHLETGNLKLVVKKGGNARSLEEAGWVNKTPFSLPSGETSARSEDQSP